MKGLLVAVFAGLPEWREETVGQQAFRWRSAIFKKPVKGPVYLGKTNLAGDRQADQKNHGGPDKAVLAYSASHYPLWREELGNPFLGAGGFGENFTISGWTENDVCIGDTFRIGEAVVQISQPRQPCWKLGRRWGIPDLHQRVQETGRTGWYFRVLSEGFIESGQEMVLLDRSFPHLTVARCNEIMRRRQDDQEAVAELVACPALSESWARLLQKI